MKRSCSFVIPESLYRRLNAHLFPGDDDEHGAVILAGYALVNGHSRLLARELYIAQDGLDHVNGQYGYKMIRAEFIRPLIRRARLQKLVYIGIHNHGGSTSVSFSQDDLDSHERAHPALLDLAEGMPVGAAVFARDAAAGDIWFPDGTRLVLHETRILGANIRSIYPRQPNDANAITGREYCRQVQMFGAAGQERLHQAKVAVVGAGGVGSLLVEYLARLGIGSLVVIDPEHIDISNLSRVVGASIKDVTGETIRKSWRHWPILKALFHTRNEPSLKIDIARNVAKQANANILYQGIAGDFAKNFVAKQVLDCDFLFLAADSMSARLVFNAIVQQYYIPGIQIGSLIATDKAGGELERVFSVTRWSTPGIGCLWCSDSIDRYQLALEAKSDAQRAEQAYGTDISNPSVITVNAVGAASAANDFLFSYLGLFSDEVVPAPRRTQHLDRRVTTEKLEPGPNCPECSRDNDSRLGRGDMCELPTTQ